jgi:putative acyl-CoA dehydrogenase
MARIYREMPVNSIWEGAGNIQSLDLLRALRKGPTVDVLMHETAVARAAHADVQRLGERVRRGLDGDVGDSEARRLARDLALLVQAALLQHSAPPPVFDAFCIGRIGQASDVFGALPARVAVDAVLARAMP